MPLQRTLLHARHARYARYACHACYARYACALQRTRPAVDSNTGYPHGNFRYIRSLPCGKHTYC
ncbi:uncharacterized protein K452DRAFT_293059 [Aplosporella prunicola CBS 121167]|uniref:Uncharacterized protein n=1 Tax=Aplosporella prunicola CBS 121167 TaxID=1176127 RepID=A0A6A6AUF6_9PEZI|nr:uncharacterized protein K452DRAFT_293059 [Aplosporella prunicola CBS 121167]KAF2135642.1 hypothetical protein K452DRAFT_293059 [Aplosporella prunicola CBS 121167]